MRKNILLLVIALTFIVGCQKKAENIPPVVDDTIIEIELPPLESREYGQIITNDAYLYAEPVEDAQVVTYLEKNIVVLILDKKEIPNELNEVHTWYRVYKNTELNGWIKEQHLYIPEEKSNSSISDASDREDINEYVIKSAGNDTADINWSFYKDHTTKLSIYFLEVNSTIEYYGKWKLNNNIIDVTIELDNKNVGANLKNLKALFSQMNPKIKNIGNTEVDIEIDISPDLDWIWIYGIKCTAKIL